MQQGLVDLCRRPDAKRGLLRWCHATPRGKYDKLSYLVTTLLPLSRSSTRDLKIGRFGRFASLNDVASLENLVLVCIFNVQMCTLPEGQAK